MAAQAGGAGQDPRTVTLRTVAAHAGVSKSLVSRVLQGSPQVSPAKREAVERAIRELGYRPNASARSLTQRRTMAVGVIVADLGQPWFAGMLEGLGTTLGEAGLHALIGDGRVDRLIDDRLVRAFIEMRVDGLVLAGAMPSSPVLAEAASRIPTVLAGSRDAVVPGVDVVVPDDVHGTTLALEHLHELGHTRIAHVAGTAGSSVLGRRAAYISWMSRHLLAPIVQPCDTTEIGGYAAARRLLDVAPGRRPTAIFAANDLAALGVLGAARQLGFSVPQELSVVGYDNSSVAQMHLTDLTTVDADARELGRQAADLLIERIAVPARPTRVEVLTTGLVVRTSTARAPVLE
ncbi:MAG: LacI family DNA-binding transcriptional regulator [Tetrasphaera sp.]